MGGGKWDAESYSTSHSERLASGTPHFAHTEDVRAGRAKGVHESVDPKKVAGVTSPFAGKPVRESRDSEEHPNSVPVVFIFDVTGSMHRIPQVLQEKLPQLLQHIKDTAGIEDVQILVGAVGDFFADRTPFQVGFFESDNRIDEQLRSLNLEGGGGGPDCESYGLAIRFAAHHTDIDSFSKRGKKGYFFTMGDENLYPTVTKKEILQVFGIPAQEDESVESLLARAREKWHMIHLFAMDGSYPNATHIHENWQRLYGQNFVKVADSSLVCEVVSGFILATEKAMDAAKVAEAMHLTGHERDVVTNALVPVINSVPAHIGASALPTGHEDGVADLADA